MLKVFRGHERGVQARGAHFTRVCKTDTKKTPCRHIRGVAPLNLELTTFAEERSGAHAPPTELLKATQGEVKGGHHPGEKVVKLVLIGFTPAPSAGPHVERADSLVFGLAR